VRACDTAGSLTPSALAAAVTEPSLATRTNALSWVSVMTAPGGAFVHCAERAGLRLASGG
jgi:hypothetical protein